MRLGGYKRHLCAFLCVVRTQHYLIDGLTGHFYTCFCCTDFRCGVDGCSGLNPPIPRLVPHNTPFEIVMKKSLLAIAALASLAGAASAQVTIYGTVEASASTVNGGTSVLSGGNAITDPTGSARPNVASLNGLNSRLGFRGVENLGGGLQAFFSLEARILPDTGAQSGSVLFGGRSIVGLRSDKYGEIQLGRDYMPVFHVAAAGDPFSFDRTLGQAGLVHALALFPQSRENNQVQYTSPSFGGLVARASMAAGEGAPGVKRQLGGTLIYNNGPLYLGAGVEHIDSNNNLNVFTAAYNFGVVRPSLSRSDSRVGGVPRTNWTLGATAPVGSGLVRAMVSRVDTTNLVNNPAVRGDDTTKFALGYEHNLSKRTSLFTDVATASTEGRSRTSGLDVGLRHRF